MSGQHAERRQWFAVNKDKERRIHGTLGEGKSFVLVVSLNAPSQSVFHTHHTYTHTLSHSRHPSLSPLCVGSLPVCGSSPGTLSRRDSTASTPWKSQYSLHTTLSINIQHASGAVYQVGDQFTATRYDRKTTIKRERPSHSPAKEHAFPGNEGESPAPRRQPFSAFSG